MDTLDRICKMVPFDPSRPLSLQEFIDREPRFKEEVKNNFKGSKVTRIIIKIGGFKQKYGHACSRGCHTGDKLAEQFPSICGP